VRDEPAQEWEVRRDAPDHGLVESGGEHVERSVPVSSVSDDLRDQRVVRDADLVAFLDPGVHTNRPL
jgi:hypothetical protein